MSPALQADSSLSEPPEKPAVGKAKRGAGCTCFPNQRETFLALKFNNFSALLTADPGKSCFILFNHLPTPATSFVEVYDEQI